MTALDMGDALLMVKKMACSYRRSPLGYDDAVAVGNLELVVASARFEKDRGVAFSSYAYPRVRGAMRDANRRVHGSRRLPDVEVPAPDDEMARLYSCESRPFDGADIWCAIRKLRHVERHVVVLILAGYSQGEIAASWGVSPSRISQHLARVRRSLYAAAWA